MLPDQEGIKQLLDHSLVFFRQALHFLKLPQQLPVFKVGLGRFLDRTIQQVVAADIQGVGQALQCIAAGPGGPALKAVNVSVMQSSQFSQLGLRQVFLFAELTQAFRKTVRNIRHIQRLSLFFSYR